jgi:hypothetical protein
VITAADGHRACKGLSLISTLCLGSLLFFVFGVSFLYLLQFAVTSCWCFV